MKKGKRQLLVRLMCVMLVFMNITPKVQISANELRQEENNDKVDIEEDNSNECSMEKTISSNEKKNLEEKGTEGIKKSDKIEERIEVNNEAVESTDVEKGEESSIDESIKYEERTVSASGKCGDNLIWTFKDGILTISGTGDMYDYSRDELNSTAPWIKYNEGALTNSLIIEEGVTKIGDYAFYGCAGFSGSLTIPNSVTSIGSHAFMGCNGFTENLIVPDSVTSIGNYAFCLCQGFTSLIISNSITSIEEYVFSSCDFTGDLIIPNSVTSIGTGAFQFCSEFTEDLIIPDSVMSIGLRAFAESSFKNIYFGSVVPNLKSTCFSGITANIYYPSGLEGWDEAIKLNYDGNLNWIAYPEGTKPWLKGIFFSDSHYSVYTNEEVLIMAQIPNSKTLTKSDFLWINDNLDAVTIISTDEGMLGDCAYAFATIRGTGSAGQTASIKLQVSDGKSAYCIVSCKGQKPAKAQPSYKVPEKREGYDLLQKHNDDWQKAYDEYITAVQNTLYEYASSDEGKRETIIENMAKQMQQDDKKSLSKHLTFSADFPSSWSKGNVYKALATYLCDNTCSKMNFNGSTNEKNIVNAVMKSLSSSSENYEFGNIVMTVSAFQFSGTKTGSITCYNKQYPNRRYIVTVCSTQAECKSAVNDFYDQLYDLESAAVYNIYAAVGQDILGKPLSTYTEKWLKQNLSKYVSQLNKTGVGDLYNNLMKCYDYYQFVSKISLGDTDAAGKLFEKIAALNFEDKTIEDRIVKKAMKKLKNTSGALNQAYTDYISGNLRENALQKVIRAVFSCPVEISVLNSNGDQIGYVSEDDIWYTDAISIEENGGAKIINSWTNDQLTFIVTGTDYGVLGCSIEEYAIGNEPIGRVNFYDIPLDSGTVLTLSMPDTLSGTVESVSISSSDGSQIVADEYISAEDEGGVQINCAVETDNGLNGGKVFGTGVHIRGSEAVLLAVPETGYRFGGWYYDDVLTTTSKVYEFTVKEMVNLRALFCYEETDDLSEPGIPIPDTVYTVTFDMQNHGVALEPYTHVAAGSTIKEPVTPTSDGYIFSGWYKEASCENKWNFETDVVQEDITLYAYWIKNESAGTPSEPVDPDNPISPDNPSNQEPEFITLYSSDKQACIPDYPSSGYIYTGKAQKPKVIVLDKAGNPLQLKKDYTLKYTKNINAGQAQIIIKGKGKKKTEVGTKKITFTIRQAELNEISFLVASVKPKTYTAKPQRPSVKIWMKMENGKKKALKAKKDYILNYDNNINTGEAAIIINARENGNYTGSLTQSFTINRKPINKGMKVSRISEQTYAGNAVCPEPVVKFGGIILKKGTDYTLSYQNNMQAGKAQVIITGMGNYEGTLKKYFKIK